MLLTTSTRDTYNYLRVALVALVLLQGFAVLFVGLRGTGLLGSLSEYYYSPARDVFVGGLVAIGVCLIVIKGRPGWEDMLLNIAGMLAPVVAFVPSRRCLKEEGCAVGESVTPPELLTAVQTNTWAALIVGAAGLAFTGWLLWRALAQGDGDKLRPRVLGFIVAVLVWLALLAAFTLFEDHFFQGAHYVAAMLMFIALTGAAAVNDREAPHERSGRAALRGHLRAQALAARAPHRPRLALTADRHPSRNAALYRGIYRTVWVSMAGLLALGLALFIIQQVTGQPPFASWLLVVEAALMGVFGVFWGTQTIDFWYEGLPPAARRETSVR